uniref:rhodanese-like domain-containing protein n=1 Tax=Thaumasiovibrio occultus TaxID=1891184 RepID=UPI000B358BBC|nr:rhodanese-like domain-containing protein [Thaumasiovibrio occultus]
MQNFFEFVTGNMMLSLVWIGLVAAIVMSFIKEKNAAYSQVDAQAATMLINREDAVVADIRSRDEFNRSRIVDSIHILPSDVRKGNFGALEKHKTDPIIVVCKTGQTAQEIANLLAKEGGFERVYVLKMGITGWLEAKMPLVSAKKAKKK